MRATIAIGGANTRLDIGANMRRKSLAVGLIDLNMGVDVSRCCDRPSVFLVGRSIIIYTYYGGVTSSLQSKVVLTITGEPGEATRCTTWYQDRRAFAAAIDMVAGVRAGFYANRICLVASATPSD